jgi:hypothetical protein
MNQHKLLSPVVLATLLVTFPATLSACSEAADSGTMPTSEQSIDDSSSSPTATATASASPSEQSESDGDTMTMNGWELSLDLPGAPRFRQDYVSESRIHLLPMAVATDPTRERWGDIFILSPTKVYDPETQKRRPLPADPVTWLRDNPTVKVLQERRVNLRDRDGHRGWQFDVKRDGAELFGDRDGGIEGDGFERLVLWKVQDTWFLAQAGTFRGQQGLLAPEKPNDPLWKTLASATYSRS